MRYLISTICIALLLWGCDNHTAAPAKPTVVRKKIVAPKNRTAKVNTKKTVRTTKTKPAAKQRQPEAVIAKVDKTQAKAKKQLTSKEAADSRQLVASKVVSKPVGKKQPEAVVAKVNRTQAKAKKQLVSKEAADSRPLVASKAVSEPVGKKQPDSVKQKKPAISPKPEITIIGQAAKPGDAQTVAGEKPEASKPLLASYSLRPDGTPPMYDATGKIDPFAPLFQEKRAVSRKSKKKIKRIPRTPLERIDLSQLKLVGIIVASSGNRALVEESNGKGYVIKTGTYIGTNGGKIVNIKKEAVFVEEQFEDVFGEIQTRKRELKLPKPSGEF
jgi:type IV pilus assembly protein PilP